MQRKRLLSDYSKWLERKKEEEKGGISKERRKWRWDHHVYLSWQRFHTSSLNQRSIEQTGIDIPYPSQCWSFFFSFWNILFVTVYVKEWKTKTCGFFCLKELIFFLFFRDHFDKSDRNFFFWWRMLLFLIENLHDLMPYLVLFCLE